MNQSFPYTANFYAVGGFKSEQLPTFTSADVSATVQDFYEQVLHPAIVQLARGSIAKQTAIRKLAILKRVQRDAPYFSVACRYRADA